MHTQKRYLRGGKKPPNFCQQLTPYFWQGDKKQSHLKSMKEDFVFPMLSIRLFLHYSKYARSENQASTEYGKNLFLKKCNLFIPKLRIASPHISLLKRCAVSFQKNEKVNQHSVSKQQIYFFSSNSQNQVLYQNNCWEILFNLESWVFVPLRQPYLV